MIVQVTVWRDFVVFTRAPRILIRAGSLGELVAEGGTDLPLLYSRGVKHRTKGTRRAPSMPESGIVSMTKYDRAHMVRPKE